MIVRQKQTISSDEVRFWRKVKISSDINECWPWLAGKGNRDGYGSFKISLGNGKSYQRSAHRFAYKYFYGVDLGDKVGRHTCDNPICCNPFHVIPGTQADNVYDMVERKRHVSCVGKDNGFAKLDESMALEIFHCLDNHQQIGIRYGVSKATVGKIKSGYAWNHVTGLEKRRPSHGKRKI